MLLCSLYSLDIPPHEICVLFSYLSQAVACQLSEVMISFSMQNLTLVSYDSIYLYLLLLLMDLQSNPKFIE